MSPLHILGEFAAWLTAADIPLVVQSRARLAMRDTIGCMVGGSPTPAGRIAAAVAAQSAGFVRIPSSPAITSTPTMAAFAAAVHASALDFDDGHYRGGAIHPSSVIVSALMIAAQRPGTQPDRFGVAQVVGTEIGLRAAHLLWPRHQLDDYHCTGTAATLGAAAAVATLHGGDADVIARSIAIAWAHAPMATFQLPMVKESIGWSAATAVAAADLAAAGFMALPAGTRSAIDDTFPPTPFHRPGAMADPFVASLGATWELQDTYFKPYAACRYTHTALRSLAQMMSEGLTVQGVASITVHTPRASMNLSEKRPASLDHAQYSFPFVLATMLLHSAVGGAEMNEAALRDPDRLALADQVEVAHDAELDATYPAHYATRLDIERRSGTTLSLTRLIAPGDSDDPMTAKELQEKFIRLASPAVGAERAYERSMSLADPGETLDFGDPLMAATTSPGKITT